MLDRCRIVLGVTGGIAAYKAVEVCRRLVDAGAHVIPVLTEEALHFVGVATFDALASEPARTSLWHDPGGAAIPHTRLGQSADLVLVAPATARLIGTYTAGIADNLLTNVLLATNAPVVLCPAMHTEMWEHPAVQDNLRTLAGRGVHIVPPETGHLAGGDIGPGRLAEPPTIVAAVERVLLAATNQDLAGLHVLVTAGGTREPIDPVRYLTNRSSGKQGHALADEAAARGAKVTLVTTVDRPVTGGVEIVRVDTASELEQAVSERSATSDIVLMAAAVADFRPARPAATKIKKGAGIPEIALEPTTDILAALGASKRPGQTVVGFAAETDDVLVNAADKLARKGADLIVANDVSAPDTGFEHDTNQVTIVSADGAGTAVVLSDKRAVARAVLDAVLSYRARTMTRSTE
ncbi:MAG: bifunctional phosphopantothenoylcysteine decarboxylase/phosphopantothenate--cysteine ligase CoaBC [Acidimicrobiales bacterium]